MEGRVIKMPVGLRERKVKEEDPVEEFMDVDEQAALIAELRAKGEMQNRSTRHIFQIMSSGLFLAISYCTVMALTVPYMLEHQERFRSSISPLGFVFCYVLDLSAIIVAMVIVRGKRDRLLPFLGLAAGVVNLFFWVGVFAQEAPIPGISVWWLPLTPLFIVLAALYVDYDLRRLDSDINHLEQLKYQYKKV